MEQPSLVPQSPPEIAPATRMSLGARLFNVLAVPGEVFEQVRQAKSSVGNWLAPALLGTVVSWAAAWVIFSQPAINQQLTEITDQALDKQVEKMHASEAQADQMRAMARLSQKVMFVAGPVVAAFASPFLWGAILWVVGSKILKGGFPYMKGVEAVGLSNVVAILDGVVRTLLILIMGSFWAAPNAALFVKDFNPQNPTHAVLSALNVMTFWLLGVRSVGLAKLSGTSLAKAAAWVFGIWLLYTGVFMGIGFAAQALFGRS